MTAKRLAEVLARIERRDALRGALAALPGRTFARLLAHMPVMPWDDWQKIERPVRFENHRRGTGNDRQQRADAPWCKTRCA